jgi:putative glutamine amidotransferase
MAAWLFIWLAVEMAGGHAVWIRPRHPRGIAGLGGLIIGGGADVDPHLYGQQDHLPIPAKDPRHPYRRTAGLALFPLIWVGRKLAGQFALSGRDARRDALELRLIDHAVRRGLPVLGICRGEQLLNVYFGGSLHQSLKGFYVEDPETRTVLPRKTVAVAPGSRLGSLVGDGRRHVNALHCQAIDRLGRGLRVAARDRNGIVQAIEHEDLPFVLGVQWHPEYLPQVPRQRRIFQGLVEAARERMRG